MIGPKSFFGSFDAQDAQDAPPRSESPKEGGEVPKHGPNKTPKKKMTKQALKIGTFQHFLWFLEWFGHLYAYIYER